MFEDKLDTAVIGTGTAAQTAARILAEAGQRVLIVDQAPFGGTCARFGCQPKKYFVVNTHLAADTKALVGTGMRRAAETDWPDLQRFKRSFTDPVPESTERSLAEAGISTGHGVARLTENGVSVDGKQVDASTVLIASGARPRPLSMPGGELAMDSDGFLDLEELPSSLVFIGGGYISMEFAFIAAFAGSQVTVLERGPRILSQFPEELVECLEEPAAEAGIRIVVDVHANAIRPDGSGYIVETDKGEFPAERVVAAVGRIPNIESLDLAARGVKHSGRGISVDKHMRTSAPGVFAAGDCVEGKQLSPISDMEGKIAAANILTPGSVTADYRAVPSVIFTHPQLASVGLTPSEATQRGIDAMVSSGDGAGWPNYRRLNARAVRHCVVSDRVTGALLGAHIVSPYAGDQINLFALAIRHGLTVSDMTSLPWAYPTYTSDVKYMV